MEDIRKGSDSVSDLMSASTERQGAVQSKKFKKVMAIVLFVLLIVVGGWYFFTEKIDTDNAYVQGDITSIAPKVSGYVTDVMVDDNTPVKKGDVLFRIDDRDYRARRSQALANTATAKANVMNAEASIALQKATITQAEAQNKAAVAALEQTRQELNRQRRMRNESATSERLFEAAQSMFTQAVAAQEGTLANLEVQQKKLDVAQAQLESAKGMLAQAEAALMIAELDLQNTIISAPVAGVTANRKVRPGRYAVPGSPLLDVVPTDSVWVVANFKETQLQGIAPGQAVNIRVDGYPNVVLRGRVDSLAAGTGSAFSLLPPDNATGNFIRIVQRVPVKITLAEHELRGRLVPGLSVRVTINP